MRKYHAVIACVCFALILCNCKKNTRHLDVIELDTDSTIRARFNFQPGTYWIYRDSLSGRTDSFYVLSNIFTKQADQNVIYDYHLITVVEKSIDTAAARVADSAYWVYSFEGNRILLDYYYGQAGFGWGSDVRYSPCYNYPFLVGAITSEYDTAAVYSLDSSFVQYGITYSNVAAVHHYTMGDSTGLGTTRLNDWFYVNDSVGMVQIQISHPYHKINRIWKLKRYNIAR